MRVGTLSITNVGALSLTRVRTRVTPITAGRARASSKKLLTFLASTKSSDYDLAASSLEISTAPMTIQRLTVIFLLERTDDDN